MLSHASRVTKEQDKTRRQAARTQTVARLGDIVRVSAEADFPADDRDIQNVRLLFVMLQKCVFLADYALTHKAGSLFGGVVSVVKRKATGKKEVFVPAPAEGVSTVDDLRTLIAQVDGLRGSSEALDGLRRIAEDILLPRLDDILASVSSLRHDPARVVYVERFFLPFAQLFPLFVYGLNPVGEIADKIQGELASGVQAFTGDLYAAADTRFADATGDATLRGVRRILGCIGGPHLSAGYFAAPDVRLGVLKILVNLIQGILSADEATPLCAEAQAAFTHMGFSVTGDRYFDTTYVMKSTVVLPSDAAIDRMLIPGSELPGLRMRVDTPASLEFSRKHGLTQFQSQFGDELRRLMAEHFTQSGEIFIAADQAHRAAMAAAEAAHAAELEQAAEAARVAEFGAAPLGVAPLSSVESCYPPPAPALDECVIVAPAPAPQAAVSVPPSTRKYDPRVAPLLQLSISANAGSHQGRAAAVQRAVVFRQGVGTSVGVLFSQMALVDAAHCASTVGLSSRWGRQLRNYVHAPSESPDYGGAFEPAVPELRVMLKEALNLENPGFGALRQQFIAKLRELLRAPSLHTQRVCQIRLATFEAITEQDGTEVLCAEFAALVDELAQPQPADRFHRLISTQLDTYSPEGAADWRANLLAELRAYIQAEDKFVHAINPWHHHHVKRARALLRFVESTRSDNDVYTVLLGQENLFRASSDAGAQARMGSSRYTQKLKRLDEGAYEWRRTCVRLVSFYLRATHTTV